MKTLRNMRNNHIQATFLLVFVFQLIFPHASVSAQGNVKVQLITPFHELESQVEITEEEPEIELYKVTDSFLATVTAYNTVTWQTDSTPCIAASGDDICGRTDVVACSRRIPLGTQVRLNDQIYTCLDRLAMKYDRRVDINFDKDMEGAINWGKRRLVVEVLEEVK